MGYSGHMEAFQAKLDMRSTVNQISSVYVSSGAPRDATAGAVSGGVVRGDALRVHEARSLPTKFAKASHTLGAAGSTTRVLASLGVVHGAEGAWRWLPLQCPLFCYFHFFLKAFQQPLSLFLTRGC